MLTRRSILIGLGASACAPRFGPLEQAPPTPLALGWRLVPGDLFALLARIERRTPTRTELRSEEWTFRVVEVDRGIARIEARVTALGAGLTEEDLILDTPATPSPATELALGRDGRLHGVSDPSFVASLPHYALALALPTGPVALHDEWVDPIGTSAATLLP
ncbi:MAG: hypothetical protein KC912_23000, partial [Proteobacteria bacterium]|nr:hypothetical protein [Pseudomonadota bacterium]